MKTNKQKCLEMWHWLAENPGCDKNHYEQYLIEQGRHEEFHFCWACATAWKALGFVGLPDSATWRLCSKCPLNFKPEPNMLGVDCHQKHTPYSRWNKSYSAKYALAMVKLIEETWEEE